MESVPLISAVLVRVEADEAEKSSYCCVDNDLIGVGTRRKDDRSFSNLRLPHIRSRTFLSPVHVGDVKKVRKLRREQDRV